MQEHQPARVSDGCIAMQTRERSQGLKLVWRAAKFDSTRGPLTRTRRSAGFLHGSVQDGGVGFGVGALKGANHLWLVRPQMVE